MEGILQPSTDYSRTVWRLNEEVVILRELFVKRISCSRPSRVCNFFLSLAFSSWTPKERKGATSPAPLR
jgi:hypothetical protein